MKKLYILSLVGAMLISSAYTLAQNLTLSTAPSPTFVKLNKSQKAAGDTLFYEDFSDQTLSNWTVVDSTNLGHSWIWSTSAPGGQYSGNIPALNSTSAQNGYISLPSDLYNTPVPFPTNPTSQFYPMSAYITSGPIAIASSPFVELVFQQSERDCCANMRPSIGLSVDGVNWQSLSATNGRLQNLTSTNPEQISYDVSSLFANEDTVYLRFYLNGNSHYYWMIDDVLLREPLATSLSDQDLENTFELFPNPTNGLLSIQGELEFDQLELRDLNGKVVHRQDWNANDQTIDLSFLENGLYFLRLRGEEDRVEKVVIQK